MAKILQHPSGLTRKMKRGFSWTTLIFGCFVPLCRGDLKWALIMFILSAVTFGLAWLVFPFIYNGIHTKELMEKGYVLQEKGVA